MVLRDGETLAEAVQEINSLLEFGDVSQEVMLTGEAWARLLKLASSGADVLAFIDTDRTNDNVALRARVCELEATVADLGGKALTQGEIAELTQLRAVVATSQNVRELEGLRAFKRDAQAALPRLEAEVRELRASYETLRAEKNLCANQRDAAEQMQKTTLNELVMTQQMRDEARAELEVLRTFKLDITETLDGAIGRGERTCRALVDHIAKLRAFKASVENKGGMQSSVDVEEFDRELARLRAFALVVREEVFGIDPKAWPQSPDLATLTERVKAMSREASEAKELRFQLEGKQNRAVTFGRTPPSLLVWIDEADAKKSASELIDNGLGNVRLLLESGDGCVLSLADARAHANDVLQAVDAELFKPIKPKRERKKKTTCDHCGEAHRSDECGLKVDDTGGPAEGEFDPLPPPKTPPAKPKRQRKRKEPVQVDLTEALASSTTSGGVRSEAS